MNAREARDAAGASVSFVIRPNRSLPVSGVVALFVALSASALTIGVGFALKGAWLILPFAGIEVLIVGMLCYWLYRHIDDCELVVIEADRVRVMQRSGTRESRRDFPRYWARIRLDRSQDGRRPSRLRIGSHGQFVELAENINESDRLILAEELRNALRVPE
jgi:uncharacterized membrane protein